MKGSQAEFPDGDAVRSAPWGTTKVSFHRKKQACDGNSSRRESNLPVRNEAEQFIGDQGSGKDVGPLFSTTCRTQSQPRGSRPSHPRAPPMAIFSRDYGRFGTAKLKYVVRIVHPSRPVPPRSRVRDSHDPHLRPPRKWPCEGPQAPS